MRKSRIPAGMFTYPVRVVVLACAACQSPELRISMPEVPPELRFGALFVEDEHGATVGATPLMARRFGEVFADMRALELPETGRVRFAGWTEDALAPLLPADRSVLARHVLARADEGDPTLPEAAWSAAGTLEGRAATLLPAASGPAVTAPWLPPCPSLLGGTEHTIDIACASYACDATLEQRGCALRLDPGICFDGEWSGAVGPGGEVSLQGDTVGRCVRAEPETVAESALELACDGTFACRVSFYRRPLPRRLRTRVVPVLSVPRHDPSTLVYPSGWIAGLAVLDRHVAVALHADPDPRACAGGAADSLAFVDPESMAVLSRTPLPPCVAVIVRDPIAGGIVAVFDDGPIHSIARYDPDGTELLRRPIPAPELTAEHFSTGIVASGEGAWVAASFRVAHEGAATNYVAVFDAADLSLRLVSGFDGKIQAISRGDRPERLLVLEDMGDRVYTIDLAAGGARDQGLPVSNVYPQRSTSFSQLVFHAGVGRPLLSSRGPTAAIFVADGEVNPAAVYFERPAQATALATWPADPRLVIAGLTGVGGSEDALVALFDPLPRQPRFLPGSSPIGTGEVRFAVEDALGRVWMSLPASAELVRVEAP